MHISFVKYGRFRITWFSKYGVNGKQAPAQFIKKVDAEKRSGLSSATNSTICLRSAMAVSAIRTLKSISFSRSFDAESIDNGG